MPPKAEQSNFDKKKHDEMWEKWKLANPLLKNDTNLTQFRQTWNDLKKRNDVEGYDRKIIELNSLIQKSKSVLLTAFLKAPPKRPKVSEPEKPEESPAGSSRGSEFDGDRSDEISVAESEQSLSTQPGSVSSRRESAETSKSDVSEANSGRPRRHTTFTYVSDFTCVIIVEIY